MVTVKKIFSHRQLELTVLKNNLTIVTVIHNLRRQRGGRGFLNLSNIDLVNLSPWVKSKSLSRYFDSITIYLDNFIYDNFLQNSSLELVIIPKSLYKCIPKN